MKFVDPIQTQAHRTASALLLLGGFSFAGISASCSSNSPRDYIADAPRSEIGSREASYAVATTPADLKRLIAEDLEVKNANGVYSGLEAFVGENVSRGTAKRAHLIWESIHPTTMLQYGQGRSVMTGVKQLGDLLANEGAAEMETAFESLRQGDFQEVQRLHDEPMGIFHSSTAALSREVRPYAMLADGVLSYRDVAANSEASEGDVQVALDKLAAAQTELAKIGETKGMFLADAAAAQALERAGQIDAAAEYWMRIADSDEFLAQPEVMRQLVAARIKTYGVRMKERLIVEVESERRAELRARDAEHTAKVGQLQAKHESFDAWAREGFSNTARRMAEMSAEDESQKARLASLAQTAETRDEELGRATDALAVRLGTIAGRTDSLETRAAALGDETAALGEQTAALGEKTEALEREDGTIALRVDREVAQLRGDLDEAVSSLRTDQVGLVARADALEKRATKLAQSTATNATDLAEVKQRAEGLRAEAAALRNQADSLAQETGSLRGETNALRGSVQQNARSSQNLAANLASRDAELAQSLKDLADYHAAVDELTAGISLDAMDAALESTAIDTAVDSTPIEEEPVIGLTLPSPSPAAGVMSLPAYLAVHSVQDVFGVDGQMQQLTAFFMPE